MKRKIVGIFVCMLMIAISVVSVTGATIQDTVTFGETIKNYHGSIQQITCKSSVMTDWSQLAKLLASDGAADDQFGYSVSLFGDTALIGAPCDDDKGLVSGSVFVFTRTGTSWSQQQKLLASDGAEGDYFGCSVSIYGDYIIVGSMYDDSERGSAYIFKRSGTSWTQEAKLIASDGAVEDHFGSSVSIYGEYSVVGAHWDHNSNGVDAGSAYVFKRSGTSWTQEAKLIASDGADVDNFGCSVSIYGDYIIVGSIYYLTDCGSAYVFKRSGTSWTQEAKLTASDGTGNDYFGCSVSLDNYTALIGAHGNDDNGGDSGSAYVFTRSGATWTQQTKLLPLDGAADDHFGFFVSIYKEYSVVGARYDDNSNGVDAGSAYVFKRSGTSWTQEAKLTASDGAANDHFGFSVSISGYYALIGAPDDDNTNGANAGSAYVFKRPIPDLDCSGVLSWTKINPEETVAGEFLVANIGESTSLLSWNIESYPEWGHWSFTPSSGSGLTPEMGAITVGVEVTAPNEQNQQFTGEIKIVNSEDSTDYDTISVSLKTPVNRPMVHQQFLQFLQNFIQSYPHLFPIFRHLMGLY